jgi:pyruvate dehydrogenase E2 component (dihydrolipoamide acetyltransferase)
MIYSVVMPQLGLTMEEGSVVSWRKQVGDWVEKDEVLFIVETDKAEMEVESAYSGYLTSIQIELGKKVRVGSVIAILADQPSEVAAPDGESFAKAFALAPVRDESPPESKQAAPVVMNSSGSSVTPSLPQGAPGHELAASPRARRLAEQLGIDIASVRPIRGRRIVERDVQRFQFQEGGTPAAALAAKAPSIPSRAAVNRHFLAQRMAESFHSAPHFYLGVEADMTELVKFRDRQRLAFQEQGGAKLTYTDLFLRAIAIGLKEHPQVNAYWRKDAVEPRETIDVGFAVQTPEGLVAPVIRNAVQLSLFDLARQRRALTEKAQAGKLTLQEMEGGSATLTNLGSFGIDWFEAILNPPQSVILATGRISKRAMVVNDALEVCPTIVLSLSVDHRVLDGVAAAQFLGRIKELTERPAFMAT